MFQEQEKLVTAFRTMAASDVLRSAILYTIAEMAVNYGLSAEQTTAVNDFAHELLNLGETQPVAPRFPTKTVSMTDPAQKLRK